MPAFAAFLKQIVFETSFFKSLQSLLVSSGKGSQGLASHSRNFAGITFGGGNAKNTGPKQGNEDTRFDSYIELNDASQSRTYSTSQQTQERNPHWKMSDPTVSGTPGLQPVPLIYSLPEHGILRTTEVKQDFFQGPSGTMVGSH